MPASSRPTGTETILLVEDDIHVRDLARRGLRRLGYTVVESNTSEDVMQRFADHTQPIDLLITGAIVEDVPGPELAVRAQAERPDVKVLLMAGYTEDVLDETGLVDGQVHFLEKPLSLKRLGRVVRDLLDS